MPPPSVTASNAMHSLPGSPFLIGLGAGQRHAVDHAVASRTIELNPNQRRQFTGSACDSGPVELVPAWGPFEHGSRHLRYERCPTCAWTVALKLNLVDAELLAITPSPRERAALESVLGDSLLAVRLCRAILDRADADDDTDFTDPHLARLLGHATAHAPVLLLPEECAEGNEPCSHRPEEAYEDPTWECPYPDASAGCMSCSVHVGAEAGEWAGQPSVECVVQPPCSVLITLARAYEIPCATTVS